MHEVINSFRGDFRFLSNFQKSPIILNNKEYSTVEHAYQAFKTTDKCEHEEIRLAKTPALAMNLGRRNELKIRQNWHQIKFNVMLNLIRKKFAIAKLRDLLLLTDNALLIEGNDWGDVYWGICNGEGENNLGKILMKVRNEIRTKL